MKKFHICYLICKEVCSGKNVFAKNYKDALDQFTKLFGEKDILYVTTLIE